MLYMENFTAEDYKLAEEILRNAAEKNVTTYSSMSEQFQGRKYEDIRKMRLILYRLLAYDFLSGDLPRFIIIPKGLKAIRMGLVNFLDEERKKESQRDIIARRTYIGTIITVIFTVLGVLLTIASILLQYFGLM